MVVIEVNQNILVWDRFESFRDCYEITCRFGFSFSFLIVKILNHSYGYA